jgi:hypothetical protein
VTEDIMATRGFEFAYSLDHVTPMILDWPMVADAAGYKCGDALVCDSNGRADKVATNTAQVFAICQETSDGAVSDDDLLKVAIVTPTQVWKCSMDAASTSIVKVYTKTIQFADENTVDANGTTGGGMQLFDTGVDDEGNVKAYVAFVNTDVGGHWA